MDIPEIIQTLNNLLIKTKNIEDTIHNLKENLQKQLPKRPSEWGGGLIEFAKNGRSSLAEFSEEEREFIDALGGASISFGDLTTKTTRTPSSFNPKDRKNMERQLIQMLIEGAEMNDFEKQCVEEWKLDGVAEQQKHEKIWRAIYFKDDKPNPSSVTPEVRKKIEEKIIHKVKNEIELSEFEQACYIEWGIVKKIAFDPQILKEYEAWKRKI